MRTTPPSLDALARQALYGSPSELLWYLDHGAQLSKHVLTSTAFRPLSSAAATIIIHRFGVSIFAGTGVLQLAARQGNVELVHALLEAGADVDEEMHGFCTDSDGWGEGSAGPPTLALRDAIWGRHADVVGTLLGFGARVERVGRDRGLGALELAKRVGGAQVVRVLEGWVGRGGQRCQM
ncbi:hypothetical protein LTR08_007019 [Meristemomyces frigidus]|nr:hypothetical protein LTR08_007019 [Meristemomyces frigidus]